MWKLDNEITSEAVIYIISSKICKNAYDSKNSLSPIYIYIYINTVILLKREII